MKFFLITARIITGTVFMFSGFVKAVDPLGSAYKFHDYFQAFHISSLSFLSLPLAILLCTAEFICGFSVLTGIRFKNGITGMMILMIIFTPLTFVLALTNPVSDCGCFGDAIHLTNWQTFGKNVVLIILAFILFTNRNKAGSLFSNKAEWAIALTMSFMFILFAIYNLIFLPVIDFLPYKKGVNIAESSSIPGNAAADKYTTTFIYEKNGVRKEFSLNDYPANDSTWKFIDQRSVLTEKGFTPPIHDFSISCAGKDITSGILSDTGYTLLMISKKLPQASAKRLNNGFEAGKFCLNHGMRFYVLTASGTEEIKKYDSIPSICTADETTLKSMIRANPGYMLLRNGVIEGKWSWANVPEKEWFARLSEK